MTFAFKFTRPNGLTRRVVFSTRPNWPELASRISTLYSISFEHVGVSYQDSDGDEVTLSSQEELEDFYVSSPPTDVVKLTVLDLTASREDEKSIPPSPGSRGTFGGGPTPLIYDIDEDWQIPFGPAFADVNDFDRSASLHAYVETVDSSSNASRLRDSTATAPTSSSTKLDKGKGRGPPRRLSTISDNPSSTASLIESEAPPKPAVHVHAQPPTEALPDDPFGNPVMATPSGGFSPPLFSTPRGNSTTKSGRSSAAGTVRDERTQAEIPDPPSPTILPEDVPSPSASLSNDIATLLNSMSFAFNTYPELTETVRKIVNNFQNGTYWETHRETVARAAEDIRRASMDVQATLGANIQSGLADAQRFAEEESGRRVTEAISNILHIFGDATAAPPVADTTQPPPAAAPASAAPQFSVPPPPPGMLSGLARGVALPPPPPLSMPARSATLPPTFGGIPPPPPLPGSYMPPWNAFRPYGAAAAPAPATSTRPAQTDVTSPRSPEVSFYTSSPVSPDVARPRAQTNDVKAALEAAKENYKREKARYRAEREARRRRREQGGETHVSSDDPQTPVAPPREMHVAIDDTRPATPPRQIISNARGGFPQLEMISLPSPKSPKSPKSPRRMRTASGSAAPARTISRSDSQPINQAMRNIVEKLDTMGFSEQTHPNLSSRIDARLPMDAEISKDKENDVVNSVVDDLLSEEGTAANEQLLAPRAGPSGSNHPSWL
ncbi:hypothetical protein PENSPDRAFT_647597 [Peniophora sp. CONT]|nr:hypothetical protein PENSPDRAFT_647597 [Peniophora sp. CONT]